eukprot:m.1139554 g.1139554  ORF g.1139554 m.1139554 type:complete len:479 (-) comp24441_c0_seq103:1144-2580(-)
MSVFGTLFFARPNSDRITIFFPSLSCISAIVTKFSHVQQFIQFVLIVSAESYFYHCHKQNSRVNGILASWFDESANDTWFVGDVDSSKAVEATKGHYIPTPCPTGHGIFDLCCKTAHEILWYLKRREENERLDWYCHVDDDMYVLKDNLYKLLSSYNATQPWFIGPSNMWPEYVHPDPSTEHFGPYANVVNLTKSTHPLSAYCISGVLASRLKDYMEHDRFARSCGKLPDDLRLPHVLLEIANLSLTVVNDFHQQYSKHYKLPWYDLDSLRAHAVTLFDYGNMAAVHKLLQNGFGDQPWWRFISDNLLVDTRNSEKHGRKALRTAPLGYSFCRHTTQPPIQASGDNQTAKWCGPPLTVLPRERELLCFSLTTFYRIHPTHGHTWADYERCPYTLPFVPQSFGAVQGNGRLPPIAAAALANMSVTEQHSFEGAYAVYKTLPRELARSNTLGTCCISNPAVPAAMGGDCYWTAQDQNACR